MLSFAERGKLRASVALIMLAAAALACNVQFGGSIRTPVGTPTTSVTFLAPANNSVIARDAVVIFAVRATDSGPGVARIDFLVDGVAIGSEMAPAPEGQPTFTAQIAWQATGVQGHLVTAEASRADGSPIGSAGIAIEVVEATAIAVRISTATPTLTIPTLAASPAMESPSPVPTTPTTLPIPSPSPPAPGPTATEAPAPTLRVIFEFLNIRAGPGTNYQQIGRMQSGDMAKVVGRNADRTWLVIEWGAVRGWVTSSPTFVEIVGDTTHIPLVAAPDQGATPAPTQAGQPVLAPTSTIGNTADLIIEQWAMNPRTPTAGQTFYLTIQIRNQGTVDAPSSLLVGIFQPGDERSDIAVPPIRAGESVTLPPLPVTLQASGPNQTGRLIVDFNDEVPEGPVGEANNVLTITYDVN